MQVIKSDGQLAEFNKDKVIRSILNTGASRKIVDGVMQRVEPRLYEKISTQELYEIVREELEREDVCYACRYNLRDGILKLGPAGFKFEKYVASILKAYGWNARVPDRDLEGSCVWHEVDVVAEKDNRRIFIEAKFRNKFRDNVNLKDTMATWSRFLDLVDGAAVGKCDHFDEAWIVTNARFSDRSKQFGVCKGIHMIGWDFPKDYPFAKMVDNMALYPITVLNDLQQNELEALSERGLMLCKEIADKDSEELAQRVGFSSERSHELIQMCADVVSGKKQAHSHKK